MNTKQLPGIIGSGFLFVGVFAPIASVPFMGNINYFQNGKGDGLIVLILAVVSLILVLTKRFKGLWFTGPGSLAVMAFSIINLQMKMSNLEAQLEGDPAQSLFRSLTEIAMESVQLQWGWALLIFGAILITVSAAVRERPQKKR